MFEEATLTMRSGLRKIALTTHITSTLGWLGAIVGFLALAIAGLRSNDAQLVRSSYLAMELIGWCIKKLRFPHMCAFIMVRHISCDIFCRPQ